MVTQPARSSRVCTSLTNIAPLPYHRILRRCQCMSPVLAVAQPSGFSEQPPSDSQRFGSVSATLNSYRTESMQQNEFEFQNRRGQNLLGVEFLPETEQQQWATLIWHHGVCEHSGRYIPVFSHMAKAGVAVYTYDVHGHGKSEPAEASERGLIHSYDHLLDDLDTFVSIVEQRQGRKLPADSTFLGGQSMGGLMAALSVLRCQDRWAGLIVFSGAMGVVWTPVLRIQAKLGNLMSAVIPRMQMVPAVKPENLHPDPAVVQSFKDDPLIFHGDLRVRTGNELLRGIQYLEAHRQDICLPLYLVHGTKDAVTSHEAIQQFANGVSSKDLTLRLVDGGYHEMLMGDEKVESADGIIAWMKERAGKTAAADVGRDRMSGDKEQVAARGCGKSTNARL